MLVTDRNGHVEEDRTHLIAFLRLKKKKKILKERERDCLYTKKEHLLTIVIHFIKSVAFPYKFFQGGVT